MFAPNTSRVVSFLPSRESEPHFPSPLIGAFLTPFLFFFEDGVVPMHSLLPMTEATAGSDPSHRYRYTQGQSLPSDPLRLGQKREIPLCVLGFDPPIRASFDNMLFPSRSFQAEDNASRFLPGGRLHPFADFLRVLHFSVGRTLSRRFPISEA